MAVLAEASAAGIERMLALARLATGPDAAAVVVEQVGRCGFGVYGINFLSNLPSPNQSFTRQAMLASDVFWFGELLAMPSIANVRMLFAMGSALRENTSLI